MLNCEVFCIDFCCFVIMFEWHADLTRKGNRSLNSENIVDWIWFNFTLKIGIQMCYECQHQNDFAVSKCCLDRPYNVKLKVFALLFVATATSLENLTNMFEIGNHKNPLQQQHIWRYGAYDWSYERFCAILVIKSEIWLPWRPPL